MLRLGLALGVIGFFCAEVGAVLATHQVPPPLLAHAVATLFGVVLAYCAALTVVIDELLRGVRDAIGLLEGDARAGIRNASHLIRTDVASMETAVRDQFHLSDTHASPPRSSERAMQPVTSAGAPGARSKLAIAHVDESRVALAATAAFSHLLPQTSDTAAPVPAHKLPRIAWAFGEQDT
jgi:hypothetical protein